MDVLKNVVETGSGRLCRRLLRCVALVWFALGAAALAAEEVPGSGPLGAKGQDTADVVVDGYVILKVRGVAAFPAEKRAREIAQRIVIAAADDRIAPGDIRLAAEDDRTVLTAGEQYLFDLVDPDAELEG